ncbi:MAG: aminomethyl transferase family protein [Desulfobulbaceae bacterium]|nr:aminomethyl transferase family protein [Desulfobulbaceae bacterium]
MDEKMKTTPLHDWHVGRQAHMAAFGGYEMPLWYPAGAKAEHLAVISGAGLFDTTHMAVLTLHGPAVRTLLQRCFSKDLERCIGPQKMPLLAGRCVYGVFLDAEAGVIDDAIVYQCGPTDYMLVVNASMGGPIAAHLGRENHDPAGAVIRDLTDAVGKMDIQGPQAARILGRILQHPDQVFAKMVYFSFKGSFDPQLPSAAPVTLLDGTPVLVSRTGYTGEFGFELFIAPAHVEKLWNLLLAAGAPESILSCGLAARDSLRAGAGLPLSHQDIGPWLFGRNPWLFVLPWNAAATGFTKEFIGAAALPAGVDCPCTLPFAGYDPRKITISDKSLVTDVSGKPIGTLLTCTTDMAIDRVDGTIVSLATPAAAGRPEPFTPRGLCCGFVRVEAALPAGTAIVLTDGKRKLQVEIRDEIRPNRTARQPIQNML